jgi:L-aspartate oxidase
MRAVLAPHVDRVGGRDLAPLRPVVWGGIEGRPAADVRLDLQTSMTRGAGVFRTAASLADTAAKLELLAREVPPGNAEPVWHEVRNLVTLGRAVVAAAAAREESRGAHTRDDHPETRDQWLVRQLVRTSID